MADGTDLSATGGGTASAPETYQPLSMPAVAAFGLAVLYVAVIVIGCLFALLNRIPWLLPLWSFLLPALAAGLALLARMQIRRSEGTRSGLSLTAWAIGLSVGIGVGYGAYYLANFVFVRWQSKAFAEDWLKKIAVGKTDEAFHETIAPPRKIVRTPDDANDKASLRRTLELTYNTPNEQGKPGAFTSFCSAEFVRLLEMAGQKAKIEFGGVKDWEYEKGGYSVTLAYRISTDDASYPLQVKVHGAESPTHVYSGRQWNVILDETGIPADPPGGTEYTAAGKELRLQAVQAGAVAYRFVEALGRGNLEKVYLATLEAPERVKAAALFRHYLLAGPAVGPLPATDAAGQEYLADRQKILSGGLIRIEDGVFWTAPGLRPVVEADMKALFDPGKRKARHLLLQPTAIPVVTRDDRRLHLGFDFQTITPQENVLQPSLIIEGWVIVGADLDKLAGGKTTPDVWRVEALELVRGRNAPLKAGARPGR